MLLYYTAIIKKKKLKEKPTFSVLFGSIQGINPYYKL